MRAGAEETPLIPVFYILIPNFMILCILSLTDQHIENRVNLTILNI